MLRQCFDSCIIWVLGMGFLSRTLGLPGQGGAVIILQDNQVRGGVSFMALSLWLVCPVGEGSSSNRSAGGFPPTFSRCLELELETSLGGCVTRLGGARFSRLAIESSWSPKESAGPVDFFRRFSFSFHASASSFFLASFPQNTPAACLAEWYGFFLESGVVFTAPEGRTDLVGVWDEPGMFWHAGTAVTHSTKDACLWLNNWEGPGGIAPQVIPYGNPIGWEQSGSGGTPGS